MIARSQESGEIRLVNFILGEREYAIDIAAVVEIIYHREPTRIPEAPESIEGIVDLRGTMIPVVDLRRRFNVDASRKPEHILVVKLFSKEIGLMVDQVSDVFSISAREIHPAEEILDHKSPAIKAVCKVKDRLVLIVDLGHLWSGSELNRIADEVPAKS